MENVRRAMDAGMELNRRGYAALVPHCTHFMDETDSLGWQAWIEVSLAWVAASHAVLRLPGESKGADAEVAVAERLGLPVLADVPSLVAAVPRQSPDPAAGHPGHLALLREMADLHVRKAADHGAENDPLANMRAAAASGVAPDLAAWIRAKDKVHRIDRFCKTGSLINEGVVDSFMDLSACSLLALVLFRERLAAAESAREKRLPGG
jgi:hypothetical protein